MEAKLKTKGPISVISLIGSLDIEETQQLKTACERTFKNSSAKIVVDMSKAQFVGSTGLQAFLETLKQLSRVTERPIQMVGAKMEFRRILTNLELPNLDFCETEAEAVQKLNFATDTLTMAEKSKIVPDSSVGSVSTISAESTEANVSHVATEAAMTAIRKAAPRLETNPVSDPVPTSSSADSDDDLVRH